MNKSINLCVVLIDSSEGSVYDMEMEDDLYAPIDFNREEDIYEDLCSLRKRVVCTRDCHLVGQKRL